MLHLLPPDGCRRLIDLFTQSGFTFEGLTGDRKLNERASRRYGTIPYLLDQTSEPTLFNTVARWFTIGVPVPAATAADLVPAWALALFEESGMLRRNSNQWEPTVMLSPLGTMLIASDPVLKWEDDPADLVLWPNPTTQQLFNFTIRKPLRSVLDLGCGCGVQALGASQHAERVVATDLNARAAEFTAFNARLNGFDNVECIAGDAFEPVRDRTFDLMVANPPFFITPSTGLMYCENPMDLDLFCRSLVKQAPRFLEESGFFQMICEWVEIKGQPWRERIAEWLEGTGCDAWVIRQYTHSPSSYGNERARQRPPGAIPEEHRFFADWLAYAHSKNLAAVHGGLITMRKRSGNQWLRIEDEPVSLEAPFGDVILSGFAVRDLLNSASDAEILEIRPAVAPDTRLNQVLRKDAQGWIPQSLRLRLTGARPRQIEMDAAVAQFVGQFDGKTRLADLIQRLARTTDAPLDHVTRESVAITRRLLEEGYLEV